MKVKLESGEFIPDERNYLFTTAVYETYCHQAELWGKNIRTFKKGVKGYQLVYKAIATIRRT